MADEHTRDELAQLRTLVEAQQAEFAAYRARHERPRRHAPRLPRRFLPLALVALLVVLMPLATLAATPFTDLVPGSPHNANIDAIYNAGVTTGCVPNAQYCPTDNVTRQEMASFLARIGGLGTNPPVANAKTAQTATSATTATHATSADTATNATNATNAGNATTVGGLAPNGLVRVARGASTSIVTLTTTYQTVTAASVTVPAAGFVLVTAAVTAEKNAATLGTADIRLRDTTSGLASVPQFADVDGSTTLTDHSMSSTYVFPVTAAGTRTFVLEGRLFTGSAQLFNGEITALYVPFGSGGAGILGGDEPPASAPPAGGEPGERP